MAITYTKNRSAIQNAFTKQVDIKLSADAGYTTIIYVKNINISVNEQEQNLGGESSAFCHLVDFSFVWVQSKHGVDDIDVYKFKNVNCDFRFYRKNFSGDTTNYVLQLSSVRALVDFSFENSKESGFLIRGKKVISTLTSVFTTV